MTAPTPPRQRRQPAKPSPPTASKSARTSSGRSSAVSALLDETPGGHLVATGLRDVLGYQLAQAAVATTAVFAQQVGGPHDLRPVEYTLLQLIAENPGTSPVRLAQALAVTKPNITMWVDRLVGRGLVQRSPSASDKRAQELHTTRAGATLAQAATRALHGAEAQALRHLSAGERAILTELLHKVARADRG
jgi:DNA-binding MarR family transcriptional regulator